MTQGFYFIIPERKQKIDLGTKWGTDINEVEITDKYDKTIEMIELNNYGIDEVKVAELTIGQLNQLVNASNFIYDNSLYLETAIILRFLKRKYPTGFVISDYSDKYKDYEIFDEV